MVEEKVAHAEELQAENARKHPWLKLAPEFASIDGIIIMGMYLRAEAVEALEETDDRPLKRKKTVTWADGDSLSGYSTVSSDSDVESEGPRSTSDSGSAPCASSGPEASGRGAQRGEGCSYYKVMPSGPCHCDWALGCDCLATLLQIKLPRSLAKQS